MILLATEVWKSHGGVQRYMRMIVRILEERGGAFHVLSLLDGDCSRPAELESRCTVCRGSKFRFLVQAIRLGFQRKGDAVIIGHPGLLPVAWLLLMLRLCSKYAVVLHGIEAWKRLPLAHRIAARNADTIIATTQYTAREFCFLNGVDPSRCVVAPLASESHRGGPHRAPPTGGVRLLTVSRLSTADRYKGFDSLLRAVRLAADACLHCTLDIVGDGSDLDRLAKICNGLGVNETVRFHGAVSDEQLSELYRTCHIFAMPSKKEGFGIVFLEAMAAGLPCIGGNHGGTPEVIEHGESGFLVEYGDAEQILQYVRALADSPSLYSAMSQSAQRRANEVLTFENMASSWRGILQNLGDGRSDCESTGVTAAVAAVKRSHKCAELQER